MTQLLISNNPHILRNAHIVNLS